MRCLVYFRKIIPLNVGNFSVKKLIENNFVQRQQGRRKKCAARDTEGDCSNKIIIIINIYDVEEMVNMFAIYCSGQWMSRFVKSRFWPMDHRLINDDCSCMYVYGFGLYIYCMYVCLCIICTTQDVFLLLQFPTLCIYGICWWWRCRRRCRRSYAPVYVVLLIFFCFGCCCCLIEPVLQLYADITCFSSPVGMVHDVALFFNILFCMTYTLHCSIIEHSCLSLLRLAFLNTFWLTDAFYPRKVAI